MAPADRDRWLALGLLLAALALAYAVLIHPWWTVPMLEAQSRIESLQQRELRQRMQLRQAPLVAQRLAQVRQQLAGRPGFLPEASAELATVGLVQRLETAVAQASPGNRSCAITNRSPINEASRERYARVVVQVRLRCGTPELATVLHSLESGTPRLFVDNLNVLAQRHFFGAGGEASGEGGLDVSFDLYGYLRPGVAGANTDPAEGGNAP
jgi:general secretion pathway protein M